MGRWGAVVGLGFYDFEALGTQLGPDVGATGFGEVVEEGAHASGGAGQLFLQGFIGRIFPQFPRDAFVFDSSGCG